MTVTEILKKALAMPETDRALLAERLLSSLEAEPVESVEAAWQEEVDRRLKEVRSGKVKLEPWESIRDRLRKKAHAAG